MSPLKGPGKAQQHDGSAFRIAIVHARWNSTIIESLVEGAQAELLASGVKPQNIVVQSVPGSWELPIAIQRLYAASQIQSSTAPSDPTSSLLTAGDLLGASASSTDLSLSASASAAPPTSSSDATSGPSTAPFDAMIAIGVLIKGESMHFEYIADAVSQGLMRVQLDTGIPVIFGLLTVLNEQQAWARAGLGASAESHNHGEDWGRAAVELAVGRRDWGEGKIVV